MSNFGSIPLVTEPKRPTPSRRILRQAAYDFRLTMANGEQLLLTMLIPIGILFGLVYATGIPVTAGIEDTAAFQRIDFVLPGVLTVAVLSSAFASLAIATGFDRRSGALLLLATTPLSRVDLILARALSTLVIVLAQTMVLCLISLTLGWRPSGMALASLAYVIVGALSLAACAVTVAGLLRAEATLAIANGLFLILLVAGGTALPAASLPDVLAWLARFLPSGALGEGLRTSMLEGALNTSAWIPLVVLLAWGLVAALVARRTFRWD